MDFYEKIKYTVSLFVLILLTLLIGSFFLPKSHKGYYLSVRDGSNSNNSYPVHRIHSNWTFCEDTTAFVTSDRDECLRVFKELKLMQGK